MPSNHTHRIVHSSAMYKYYQNLIIIHESSKKLFTIQSVKCFLTPSMCEFVLLEMSSRTVRNV